MNYFQKKWFKLIHWEFWSFSTFYFPVYFYFLWLSIRARSFFFFTSANPNIDFGGMLGEKKSEIFDQIPKEYIPNTVLIEAKDLNHALSTALEIGFPLIAKPDIGERGKLVEKIDSEQALIDYVDKCPVNFLIQELVTYPREAGVFYVKMPNSNQGLITSIVEKKLLSVIGDGRHTIEELLRKNPRAQLQVNFEHARFTKIMQSVPTLNQEVIIEPIGNHCRGTIFLDKTSEIDNLLNDAFNDLANRIPEFYFGRFDLLFSSYEDLRQLKNFKIVELNGAGAEPGHIYQPGFSLLSAYRVVFSHFKMLAEVSRQNRKRGYAAWSFKQGLRKLKSIEKYNKRIDPVV